MCVHHVLRYSQLPARISTFSTILLVTTTCSDLSVQRSCRSWSLWNVYYRITEWWRLEGRDLWRFSYLTLLCKQGRLEQAAQDHVQTAVKFSAHSLPPLCFLWQSVPFNNCLFFLLFFYFLKGLLFLQVLLQNADALPSVKYRSNSILSWKVRLC